MIIEKAKVALEKLQRTNYKQTPDFGMDETTEQLISIIANECKSTVVKSQHIRKYGSDIVRDNIDAIIRQLILNGSCIPKETMNKIMHFDERVIGINSDINIYKGIREAEDGSLERTAAIGTATININKLEPTVLTKIDEEIYKRFARQLVLNNLKEFPRQNALLVFKEKLLHGRENRDFLAKKYRELLKENTNYSDEIIKNTVEYNLDYLYDEKFKKEVIGCINDGQSLVPLESKKKGMNLSLLLEAVSAETRRYDEFNTRYKSDKYRYFTNIFRCRSSANCVFYRYNKIKSTRD